MTVSRLLALALQAELARRHSITLAEAECEALVAAVLARMGKLAAAAPKQTGEVIAWPWQAAQAPTTTEGGSG